LAAAAIPSSSASFGGIPADLFYTRRPIVRPTLLGAIRAHGIQQQTVAATAAMSTSQELQSASNARATETASTSIVKPGATNKLQSVRFQYRFSIHVSIDHLQLHCSMVIAFTTSLSTESEFAPNREI
jgi:hypothetical protein